MIRNLTRQHYCYRPLGSSVPVYLPPESLRMQLLWHDDTIDCFEGMRVVYRELTGVAGLPPAQEGVLLLLERDEAQAASAMGRLDCCWADPRGQHGQWLERFGLVATVFHRLMDTTGDAFLSRDDRDSIRVASFAPAAASCEEVPSC